MHPILKKALIAGGMCAGASIVATTVLRRIRWFDWEGRVVLVTGGSRGLGLEIARKLVARGARVAICARTEEDLHRAEADLVRRGGDVLAIECDIRDQAAVESMVRMVLERWGTVDVLINVAGIIQVGPVEAMTPEDFREAMDSHCWGPLNTILAVLPEMRRRQWGRIVNIASIGGKQAVPHLLPYVTSKSALVGLSNGLRTELAKDGILVTTVCPMLMRTGSARNAIFKGQNDKEYAWFKISDSLPILSTNVRKAAAQVLRATQRGDVEVIVSNRLNVPVAIHKLFPTWTTEIMAAVDRLLPSMGGIGERAARGYESESRWSRSILGKLSDRAARRQNEMGSHPIPGELGAESVGS